MRISTIEIGNFRKLVAVRIDLAADKTVFVGANNSGKTSAMTALRRFLVTLKGSRLLTSAWGTGVQSMPSVPSGMLRSPQAIRCRHPI